MYILFLLFAVGGFLVPPSSTQNIANKTQPYVIPDGGQTVIQCHPDNTNATIIKWEVFGKIVGELTGLNDDENLSQFNISRTSTLIVTNPRASLMQGLVNVTCITYRNNSTNVTLERILYQVIFNKAPKITNTKLTYDVPDDGSTTATLTCSVIGFPLPDTKWMFENDTLMAGQPYFINTSDIANANLTVSSNGDLEVKSTERRGGFGVNVVCMANNSDGNTTRIFLVRFLKAPKILNDRFDIAIPERRVQHVSIPCQTIGYPRPAIHWLFGEVSLNVSHGPHPGVEVLGFEKSSSYQVFDNGSLRINNPIFKEHVPHKNFTCVASSFVGEDRKSHIFTLGALISYNFVIRLLNGSQVGAKAENIEAKIKNVLKDSLPIRSLNVTVVNITSGVVTLNLAWLEQDLARYDVNGKEKFDTAAIARDVLEKLKENNILVSSFLMKAEPGPATGLSINEVTSSTISFSWQPPEYFSVTEYQIQFNEGGSGWKNSKKISGSETSAKIDSLDPGTKYLIRMESINVHGAGIPSKAVEAETEDTLSPVIIAVVVVLVILVIIGVILGVMYYRRKSRPEDNMILGEMNPYEFSIPGVAPANIYVRGGKTVVEIDTGDISKGGGEKECYSWREIDRESLTMGDTLGQGEFGLVVKATWGSSVQAPVQVAVKTIKENATETDRKELLKELRLMAEISQHPNVVSLIGACSKGGPLWIIVELCEHGNLLSFLRKNRREISERAGDFNSSLDPLVRVRIAYDVSKGMRYLEDKKIVHRDLAARNILLGKNKIAKIADFGLSRDIYEVGMYEKKTGGKLPVKWMALESLKEAVYTTKSDVWSFGVLFWEIESAGLVPYPGIGGRDILGYLLNGFRLDRPSETPFEIYEIMKKCWEPSPKVRPTFSQIESELEAYLEERSDYLPVLIEDEPVDDEAYVNYIVDFEDETTSL